MANRTCRFHRAGASARLKKSRISGMTRRMRATVILLAQVRMTMNRPFGSYCGDSAVTRPGADAPNRRFLHRCVRNLECREFGSTRETIAKSRGFHGIASLYCLDLAASSNGRPLVRPEVLLQFGGPG